MHASVLRTGCSHSASSASDAEDRWPLARGRFAARALGLSVFLLLLLAVGAAGAWGDEPPPRPHIVLIVADDLGYADCGFSGGKEIKTPHLDALAQAGTVLETFYVQPVCSPTRAALLTGRYPMRHGLQVGVIRPQAQYGLPLSERTLPQALHEAGYFTAITGKWHLGSFNKAYWPAARGFDHAYGHLFGMIDYYTHQRDGQVDWFRNGERLVEEGYSTHLLAREAVQVIEQAAADKPCFLYVPFNGVHTPLQVPEKYLAPYGELKGQRKTYAGMLAALDEAVGQIVAAIEQKGWRKNTLFVFTSDNGGFHPGVVTNNGPLRAGKGTLYEGGVRAAAFASWPGHIPAGKRLAEPLHAVDWYPTLIALAGGSLKQAQPLDGLDLWPTLTQGQPTPHAEILLNTTPSGGAIRVGDWKLKLSVVASTSGKKNAGKQKQVAGRAADALELFHLREDVGEKTNLADKHPEKVQALRAKYERLAAQALPPKSTEGL